MKKFNETSHFLEQRVQLIQSGSMQFQMEALPSGDYTIRDQVTGECMHSTIGPWVEAQHLYIEQSQLAHRLEESHSKPLVIYDLGLGMATNALAVIDTFYKAKKKRGIHLVSFENQLEGLHYALQNAELLPFIQKNQSLLRTLLKKRTLELQCGDAFLRWDLKGGDFPQSLRGSPLADLIFYDFYSPQSTPHLWTMNCFQSLLQVAQTPQVSLHSTQQSTQLYTYCSATSVRAALLLAGFYVGYGVSTGKKRDTTVASTQWRDLRKVLGDEWLMRWSRSEKPLPLDCISFSKIQLAQKLKSMIEKQNEAF